MIEGLCHVLGNTCRIGRTAMCYSWNVSGAGASAAQRSLADQADELHNALTPIAYLIRGLKGSAILDYSDLQLGLNTPAHRDFPSLREICTILDAGHREATLSIQTTLDLAVERNEHGAVNVLAGRLTAHREHIWQLGLLHETNLT